MSEEPPDTLFDMPPEPEPLPDRPDLDMDNFFPNKPPHLPEPTTRDYIPPEALDALAPRREAFQRRFDELTHQGMPEKIKYQRLYDEFPEFKDPTDVSDEVAEIKDNLGDSPPRPKRSAAHSPSVRRRAGYEKRHPPPVDPDMLPDVDERSIEIAKGYIEGFLDETGGEEPEPEEPEKQ